MKKNFTRFFCALLCFYPLLISFHAKGPIRAGAFFLCQSICHHAQPIFLQAIGTGNFTIEAWVYWRGGGNWQRIFDIGTGTTELYVFVCFRKSFRRARLTGDHCLVLKWLAYPERRVTCCNSICLRNLDAHCCNCRLCQSFSAPRPIYM